MSYLNKYYTFNCFNNQFCVRFIIENIESKIEKNIESAAEFLLRISIESMDKNGEEEYSSIKLKRKLNDVYRSDWINVRKEFLYKNYIIQKIKVMLKFRNNSLSQVSSLYVQCICPINKKDRNFAFSLSNISELKKSDIQHK